MLLEQRKFVEAISFLSKANYIEIRRNIFHNISYCHIQMKNFLQQRSFSRNLPRSQTQEIEAFTISHYLNGN